MQTEAEIEILILLPVRNEELTLKRAISSVLEQNCNNFRLIISDNFSDDSTPSIISEFQRIDNRIVRVNPHQTLSVYEHFNFIIKYGLDAFRPKFIHLLAGDDYFTSRDYLTYLKVCGGEDSVVIPNYKIEYPWGVKDLMFSLRRLRKNEYFRKAHHIITGTMVYPFYSLIPAKVLRDIYSKRSSPFSEYYGSDWWFVFSLLSCEVNYTNKSTYFKGSKEEYKYAEFMNSLNPIKKIVNYFSYLLLYPLSATRKHFSFRPKEITSELSRPLLYYVFFCKYLIFVYRAALIDGFRRLRSSFNSRL